MDYVLGVGFTSRLMDRLRQKEGWAYGCGSQLSSGSQDKVGQFLKATRAQYLITTPNTHNINVFSPAELTLVTRKKQPDQSWAQPIAMARRQVVHG